jgi:hypothetical protein
MSRHEHNGCRPGDTPSGATNAPTPTHLRGRLARLRQDQRRRWQDGERVRVEDYLREQPELADDEELLVDFICHEVLLDREWGEELSWDDYVRRFPRYAAALRLQQELDEALGDTVGLMARAGGAFPTPWAAGAGKGNCPWCPGMRSWGSWAAGGWGSSTGPGSTGPTAWWR